MSLVDDNDSVRALGFVTLHAAWIEQDVDDLLRIMSEVEPFDEKKQRWQISRKLEHALKLVHRLNSDELHDLPKLLKGAMTLFERRNDFVHGRIFAAHDRVDYIKGGRPNAPTKPITSSELYSLANTMWDYHGRLSGVKILRLPKAVENYLNRGLQSSHS